jgi:glutathione S-transferase
MAEVTIVGGPISPFVRKILATLALKKVPYGIDPIVPFFGDERFTQISPLRRIPVLLDGDLAIADSSVIAQYLEETHPEPSVLPRAPAERARARFIEEFADTRMADVFLWRCFYSVVVKPSVFGGERDLEAHQKALAGPVVEIMDYLERSAPADGFLFGPVGLADISVAVLFRNMRYCRWTPDPERWPKAAAWIGRTEAQSCLAPFNEWADALVKTPISQHLEKARELGLPLTGQSLFAATPSAGPMTVPA